MAPILQSGNGGSERVSKLLKSHSSEAKLEFEPSSFTPQPSLINKYMAPTEVADTSHPGWKPGKVRGWDCCLWSKLHHSDFPALISKSTPQKPSCFQSPDSTTLGRHDGKVHLFLELAGSPSSPREGKTHPSLHQGQGRLASESRMRVPTTSRFGWTLGKRVTIFCHLQDTWRKYNAQWYGIKPDKKINLLFQPFLNNTSLVSPGLGCDEKQHHTP